MRCQGNAEAEIRQNQFHQVHQDRHTGNKASRKGSLGRVGVVCGASGGGRGPGNSGFCNDRLGDEDSSPSEFYSGRGHH